MKRVLFVPIAALLAVLAVYLGAVSARAANAGEPALVSSSAPSSSASVNLASAIADRDAEDAEENVGVAELFFGEAANCEAGECPLNLFYGDGSGIAPLAWSTGSGLTELIDELLESGDLTEAGAARLREQLSAQHGLAINVFGNAPVAGFPSPATGRWFSPGAEGEQDMHFRFNEDGVWKELKIEIGEDGIVSVEGEGYSPEELEEIRRQTEEDIAAGRPVSVYGKHGLGQAFVWNDITDGDSFAVAVPDFNERWTDENGDFDAERFAEGFPAPHSFSWSPDAPASAKPIFMFGSDDEELREMLKEIVREIMQEMKDE
ncbi:MAG: hypothetical protein R3F46_08445 [bacterium]